MKIARTMYASNSDIALVINALDLLLDRENSKSDRYKVAENIADLIEHFQDIAKEIK